MSARAVGARLLLEMELEELGKATVGWFMATYGAHIETDASLRALDKWVPFAAKVKRYEVAERALGRFIDGKQKEAYARYERRVAQWGDWWLERAGGGLHEFVVDLLDRIERGVSETHIQRAHDEAIDLHIGWMLERELGIAAA